MFDLYIWESVFSLNAKTHFMGQQIMTEYVRPYVSTNVLFIASHKMFHWTFVVGLFRILMLPVTSSLNLLCSHLWIYTFLV